MTRTHGTHLADQIASARSEQEVQSLLAKGRSYFAGRRTQKNWQRIATQRLAQLRNGGSK